jgi:hypothetical protein
MLALEVHAANHHAAQTAQAAASALLLRRHCCWELLGCLQESQLVLMLLQEHLPGRSG